MTGRGAAFFDRDGTLTEDKGYTYKVDDLRWLPGAVAALRLCKDAGLLTIVVTNQSGIGRGYYSEAQMHAFHAAMNEALTAQGARVDAFYFCPYLDDATLPEFAVKDHPDRKPRPGMLLRAMRDFAVDPALSFMIGDRDDDVEAARAAGIAGYKVASGEIEAVAAAAIARAM